MNNKRQYERIPFNEETTLILVDGHRIQGFASDGGFGGYLFVPGQADPTIANLHIGEICRIEVDLFGQKTCMNCTVVRLDCKGIGLKLQRLHPAPMDSHA